MFVFWGFVCECPTARYPIPPGEVRVLRGTGRQGDSRDPVGYALGGTAGRCCSHINQGGKGQVTEPGAGRDGKKQRKIRFKQGKDVEKGFSSPYVHPFPLRRPLMEEKQL